MGTAVVHSWVQDCCHFLCFQTLATARHHLVRVTSSPGGVTPLSSPQGQHRPKLRFTPVVPTVAVPKHGSGQPWRLAPTPLSAPQLRSGCSDLPLSPALVAPDSLLPSTVTQGA